MGNPTLVLLNQLKHTRHLPGVCSNTSVVFDISYISHVRQGLNKSTKLSQVAWANVPPKPEEWLAPPSIRSTCSLCSVCSAPPVDDVHKDWMFCDVLCMQRGKVMGRERESSSIIQQSHQRHGRLGTHLHRQETGPGLDEIG